MTDKARELLERALDYVHKRSLDEEILRDEIRAYLAQPEVKRETLSEEEIYRELIKNDNYSRSFTAGVRFAEKHNGIGGRDE